MKPPASALWRRFGSALSVSAIGIALSIAAWFAVAAWEAQITQESFNKTSARQVQVLQAGIDENLQKLAALRALFDSSDNGVTREEFGRFTAELPNHSKAILNFAWLPRVSRAGRAAHERAAVAQGLAGYRITALDRDDHIVRAPERAEYFPLSYVSLTGTPAIYGFDLNDGGLRQRPLDRARDRDAMAASGNIKLHSVTGDRSGFILVLPVYRRGVPHATLAQRRENLLGYVRGAFQFRLMVDSILTDMKTSLNYALFETAPGPGDPPGLVHAGGVGQARYGSLSEAMPTGLRWIGAIHTGDRTWRVVVTPAAGASTLTRYNRAWIILFAGLAITALLVAYMIKSIRHVGRLQAAEEKASALARTDMLTGLANRRAFIEALGVAFAGVARGDAPFAVHLIDIDAFKDINDTLGHSTGDILLRQIADRLSAIIAPGGMIARLGSDEFAILQPAVPQASDAERAAARMIDTIALPYRIAGIDLRVAASIGIARHSRYAEDPAAMLIQADLALYSAKDAGRGCIRFHSATLDQQVRLRVTLAAELREGIIRGELELHYQTQVEIRTGRIIGLEALVRWNHPVRGVIVPGIFIPIAERSGAIVALGEWVLTNACRQVRDWEDRGYAVPPVAVNVSGAQLRQGYDFEHCVAENFSLFGIRPKAIELELTESVLMDVTERQGDAINRLQQLGASIAIDDFGTGYSSLQYLTTYPVHRLKIAQALIEGVLTDPRSAVVVRSAIRLARDLGIACIAEGVERAEEARILSDLGCEYAQGYFYSCPVPAAQLTPLLAHAKPGRPKRERVRMHG